MAGGGPSVVRAGFMQACMLPAPLLGREEDAVPSLSASLALLLLLNPSACASVRLQLSFAAMAGIILLTPRMEAAAKAWLKEREQPQLRLVRKLTGAVIRSVTGSLGGLVFSVPIVAAHFGNISLVSPLTNLLCLWVISLLFTCGLAAVLIGLLLPPAGLALGWCLSILVRGLFLVIRLLAGIPFAAVYTSNPLFAWWLGLIYVLFLTAWLFRRKHGLRPVLPCCFSLLALCAVILLTKHADGRAALRLTALDVGQGQSVVLQSGTAAVVVDCGGAAKENNAGDTAARYILGRCRQGVDALLLTHLHSDHANGVVRLLQQVEVRCLVLPADADDTDGFLPDILTAAEKHGTDVLFVGEDMHFSWGEMSLSVFAARRGSSDNERGLVILASALDFDVLITGDAGRERERQLIHGAALPDIEVLLAGHHGSKTSTGDLLLEAVKPELCIVSVGWNIYGHPAAETLERLSSHRAEIRRTDREGHITVRFP
jgi:competence protein ComEC